MEKKADIEGNVLVDQFVMLTLVELNIQEASQFDS